MAAVGAKTAYIAPGSPWENGYIESFNAGLRDELLEGEIFYTLKEAQIGSNWRFLQAVRRTSPLATDHQPLRSSYQRSPRGRLRVGIAPTARHAGVETWAISIGYTKAKLLMTRP